MTAPTVVAGATVGGTRVARTRRRVDIPPADLRVPRPRWLTLYTAGLVVLDVTAVAAATFTAKVSWFGVDPEPFYVRGHAFAYTSLVIATVPTWIVILAFTGAYDLGPFGRSRGAWTPVVRAGAQLLAVIAVSYYILHLAAVGRGVLVALVPLAVALTIAARAAAAATLDALRRRGLARRRVFVLGSRRGVEEVLARVEATPTSGVDVVGRAVIDGPGTIPRNGASNGSAEHDGSVAAGLPPWQPSLLVVHDTLARTEAEALVVAGGLAPGRLREVAWMLEGTGVALLVMPSPNGTDGLRAATRPVAGLPLLRLTP
jgi:hypothetical protein